MAAEEPVEVHVKEPPPPEAEAPRARRRRSWAWEQLRMLLQIAAAGPALLAAWAALAAPYVGVLPHRVPRRVFEDTFGKLEDVLSWEPPSMDRSRYETEGNVWRPFVFSSASAVGLLQDLAFGAFNWGAGAICRGPALPRAGALLLGGCAAAFGCGLLPLVVMGLALGPLALPLRFLLRNLPEQLLTLEQLLFAHHLHGRALSPELLSEAAAASLHSG